jgi:hypothetical protein
MDSHADEVGTSAVRNSDDDDPEVSRRNRARVSRACNRCRTRKDKCDGRRPQCSNCDAVGHPCVYVAAGKKRGLPEGYVRGLEKLWAVMLLKVNGLSDAIHAVTAVDHEEDLLRIWNHPKAGEELHTMWKESSVLTDLDRLLNKLDSGGHKRKRDVNGEPLDHREEALTIDNLPALQAQFHLIRSATNSSVPGDASVGAGGLHKTKQYAQLPAEASYLFSQYFTYTHCWFPILDKPQLMRKLYEHRSQRRDTNGADAHLASLWAVCAHAQHQLADATNVDSVLWMRRIALDALPAEGGPFSIFDVQTLLLIVLLDVDQGHWTSAWMLMGTAIRSLIDTVSVLRGNSNIAAPTRQLQATQQGAFILDTLLSWKLRRPSHLRSNYIQRSSLLDEDGHDEWEPWASTIDAQGAREPAFIVSTYNRLTEVCVIINDSCEGNWQGVKMASPEDTAARLRALSTRFPFDCSIVTQRPPHQLLLQACYIACQTATGGLYPQFDIPISPTQVMQQFTQICRIPSLAVTFYNLDVESTSPHVSRGPGSIPTASSLASVMAAPSRPFAQPESYLGHTHRNLDIPMQSDLALDTTTGSEIARNSVSAMATSPSFNGDEIDALFHEMAQLDTTQWTDNRTQGLKDFGFADDSTFEAFCNDPDRLVFPEAYMAPAFNGGQSTMYDGPAQPLQHRNPQQTNLGRMSFEDIFR